MCLIMVSGSVLYSIKVHPKSNKARSQFKDISGCFVLISNLPKTGQNAHEDCALLTAYKGQYGVEMNFRFLKDPLIVNDTFLKKAELKAELSS